MPQTTMGQGSQGTAEYRGASPQRTIEDCIGAVDNAIAAIDFVKQLWIDSEECGFFTHAKTWEVYGNLQQLRRGLLEDQVGYQSNARTGSGNIGSRQPYVPRNR